MDKIAEKMSIKNFSQLISHGNSKLRKDALKIIQAGIRGANPAIETYKKISLDGDSIQVDKKKYLLNNIGKIYFVGVGKGSFPIAQSLENILGSLICEGVLVVKRGENRKLKSIDIFEADHPIPDKNSVLGAHKILDIVKKAGEKDLIFAAITGGASALATLPPEEIVLEDIQQLNDLLLKSGAKIEKINIVRRHLCRIKGGHLLEHIQPAEAIVLTLDTVQNGMPWPDMCMLDDSTFQDAIDVLKHLHLWNKISSSVRQYLIKGCIHPELETLKSIAGMRVTTVMVGSSKKACHEAAKCAQRIGYKSVILSTQIDGEAKELGIFLSGIAKEVIRNQRPFSPPCVIISGGETTVTIGEECGQGGPNQETVLGFVNNFNLDADIVFASVDTDGTDGPTELAGGLVDNFTLARARELNLYLDDFLVNHNASEALIALNDAIMTGHTGTNVMNLRVLIIP